MTSITALRPAAVTKYDVIALNEQHPEWTAADIAQELGCLREYVHATGKRNGLKFAKAKPGPQKSSMQFQVDVLTREIKSALNDVEFLRLAINANDHRSSLLERCDDLAYHLREAINRG